jgi:hypothetical protein
MLDLRCYPQLEVLELQYNCIAGVAEQTSMLALKKLKLSHNQLHDIHQLEILRMLADLTELQLTGNAMQQNPRQAALPDWVMCLSETRW